MSPKLKKIIIAIIVLALLFVVYAVFIKADPINEALVEGRAAVGSLEGQNDAIVLGNQIAQALMRIEQISLDKAIFTNNIYVSLRDRSRPITEEPIGRPNPFAPLGDNASLISVIKNVDNTSTATSSTPVSTTTQKNISNPATINN